MPSKIFRSLQNRVSPPAIGLAVMTLITTACPNISLAQVAPTTNRSALPSSQSVSRAELPYTLGAGDRVRVDVYRVPQYSGEVDVLVDGSLNLALVGSVPVEGLTLKQSSGTISTAYSRYLKQPIVTVTLLSRRPVQIGVAGEVNRPGSYTVPPNDPRAATVTRLLEAAGGTTQIADVRQIQVRRPQRSGADQIINVDLWQLLQTGNLAYDTALRDGDTVMIPTNPAINLSEAPLLAAATFSGATGQPVNIAVVGEVNRPGAYTIAGNQGNTGTAVARLGSFATVTRALQSAGGIKPLANIREVEVRRLTRTGTEQSLKVNLWDLLRGDLRQDAILQEGDTIVVPTAVALNPAEAATTAAATFSPNSIRVNIVGEVARSGTVELSPNVPLNQGILAAGGFNNRARKGSVQLVRLNVDGTVSKRTIDIDFAQGINTANNPTLQNNDVIIVGKSTLAGISDTLSQVLAPIGSALSVFQVPFRFLNIFR